MLAAFAFTAQATFLVALVVCLRDHGAMRSRWPLACALAAVLASAVWAAPARAAGHDLICVPRARAVATVLVLRGGYFLRGDAHARAPARACRRFAAAGLRAVSVDFPNGHFFTALGYIRRIAARERRRSSRLFVYGESAGGTYAELLAEHHQVDAAVAVSSPTDLTTWQADDRDFWIGAMHMSLADRRRGSPVTGPSSSARLLLLSSPEDQIVPFAQASALAAHLRPDATLARLTGAHMADTHALPAAVGWLRGRR